MLLLPRAVVLRRRILAYLYSDDPRLVKHAIQTLCILLDANPGLSLSDEVRVGISLHAGSPHLLVRRWLSKLFALLGDRDYLPWVRNDLLLAETDLENRTWAVSALAALEPHVDLRGLLRSLDVSAVDSPYTLAVRYLRPETHSVDRRAAIRAAEADDLISPMWIALLHSRARDLVPHDVVKALTAHHEPSVAEYSLWALVQHPGAGLADSELDPLAIPSMATQNRRWALRLLGKDRTTVHNFADLLMYMAEHESEPVVREGLALAIQPWRLVGPLPNRVASWYVVESDELTVNALADHLERFAPEVDIYRDALAARPPADSSKTILTGYPPSAFHILVPRQQRRTRMAIPPGIREFHREETYLLAMDTVGFSKLPDSDQVSVLQQLLAACAQDRNASSVPAENVVYLITGDGLIIGFRGTSTALVPLKLALRLAEHFARLHDYSIRFGIHSGPAEWISLDEGGRQLIGHAVNWTTRVMDRAAAGQVLVSQSYFDNQAHPARDYLQGVVFEPQEPAETKHGEPLVLLEARIAAQAS